MQISTRQTRAFHPIICIFAVLNVLSCCRGAIDMSGQGPSDIFPADFMNRQLLSHHAGVGAKQVNLIPPPATPSASAPSSAPPNNPILDSVTRPNPADRPPAWYGRFDPIYKRSYIAPAIGQNTCKSSGRNCAAIHGMSYPYEEYILDPTSTVVPAQPVMKVYYPKGSWAAGAKFPGGTLFYIYPFKTNPTKDTSNQFSKTAATLEYEVYFPENYDFVKGGKLPGMSGGGGQGANGRGCGGGADPAYCFSFRIMWRANGKGEAYLYVPQGMQANDFCTYYPPCSGKTQDKACIVCNFAAGVSFGRGAFTFNKGAWNKITMTMVLNTPNVTNGYLEVKHNDVTAISYDKINFRQTGNTFIEGIEFATWFGGGDSSWAPPNDTYTMFRNIKAWRYDAPNPSHQRSLDQPMNPAIGQVIHEEEMYYQP